MCLLPNAEEVAKLAKSFGRPHSAFIFRPKVSVTFDPPTNGHRVALQQSIPVRLRFGASGEFSCELDASKVAVFRPGPVPRENVRDAIDRALQSPIDMPTLDQALVPDDRIVIALDRDTPCAAETLASIWHWMEKRGIDPARVSIIQPASLTGKATDPRSLLPESVSREIAWTIHDPTSDDACAYLATSTKGERIYLAREVVEADFVLPVTSVGFDPILGYRGTTSVLYPGLSSVDAIRQSIGQGHQELSPSDPRPVRQLVDEIAWLMGIQFCVQIVPGETGLSSVFAGLPEAVQRKSQELLDDHFLIRMHERVDTVVVAVSGTTTGDGWEQVGRALATARRLVKGQGRIVVLSDLAGEPGDGIRLVKEVEEPGDALSPLRSMMPPDLQAATHLANAAAWARLFSISQLPDALAEDLFMYPMENLGEVQRLLEQSESCALIGAAQHSFGIVG